MKKINFLYITCFLLFAASAGRAGEIVPRREYINRELDFHQQPSRRQNSYQQAWDQYYTEYQAKNQTRAVQSALNKFEQKEQYIDEVRASGEIKAKRHNISYRQFPEYGYTRYEYEELTEKKESKPLLASIQKVLNFGADDDDVPVQSVFDRGLSEKLPRGSISVASGRRKDEVDWNIAGNLDGTAPSVLAEYKWPEVDLWESRVDAELVLADKFVMDGSFAYASAFKGTNEVSEYSGENRTDLAVLTNTKSDDGHSYDGSLGVGMVFDLKRQNSFESLDSLYMKMLGGYAYHTHHLTMREGNETFNAFAAPSGSFDGLDSTYDMRWQGPWMGLELRGSEEKLSSLARLKYHYFDYYGEGDLNLQPNFQHPKSFDHNAEGTGFSVDVGMGYKLTSSWDINLLWSMKDWQVQNGVDRLYLNDGSTFDTRLNDVNLLSQSLMLGSQYSF